MDAIPRSTVKLIAYHPRGLLLRVVSLNILIAYLEVDVRKEENFVIFSKLLSFEKPQRNISPLPLPPLPPKPPALQIYKYNEVT